MLAAAREFFARRSVQEVETPVLTARTVTEPHIASVRAVLSGTSNQNYYLQTSPEYFMKRLLADGSPDIFQICRVFRDGEAGRVHQPEFTMIEWYRRALDLDGMIAETLALLDVIAGAAGIDTPRHRRYRYPDLFFDATGLDAAAAPPDRLRERAAHDPAIAADRQLMTAIGNDRASLLDLLFSHLVVPRLPPRDLVAVTHYPACQAALARLDPSDHTVAERFELFRNGVELANGYHELRDAGEQRTRFERDRQRRQELGLPDVCIDQQLLDALSAGLPDCCGVAVGFDRVVMSYCGLASIQESVSFAVTGAPQPT